MVDYLIRICKPSKSIQNSMKFDDAGKRDHLSFCAPLLFPPVTQMHASDSLIMPQKRMKNQKRRSLINPRNRQLGASSSCRKPHGLHLLCLPIAQPSTSFPSRKIHRPSQRLSEPLTERPNAKRRIVCGETPYRPPPPHDVTSGFENEKLSSFGRGTCNIELQHFNLLITPQ